MKTLVITSLSFLLFLSCTEFNTTDKIALDSTEMEDFYKASKPKLEIEILNIPKDSLSKINVSYVKAPLFKKMEPSKSIPLNKDGKFILQLDFSIPNQEIFLTVGKLYYGSLSLSKGLKISIDYKIARKELIWNYDESLTFSGDDSSLNYTLGKYSVYNIDEKQEVFQNLLEFSGKKFSDYSHFKRSLDSLNQILIETEVNFSKENNHNFLWYISHLRENEYYSQLLTYAQLNKISIDNTTQNLIKNRRSYGVTNASDQFLRNQIYSHYGIQKYTIDYWKKLYQFKKGNSRRYNQLDNFLSIWEEKLKGNPINNELFDNLKFQLSNSFLTEWQLLGIDGLSNIFDSIYEPNKSDLLKLKLWSNDLTYYEYEYNQIYKHLRTDWAKDVLSEEKKKLSKNKRDIQYDKSNATEVNSQMKSFEFGATLYDFEHIKTKDQLISKILSLNNSKYNLIDFWATWCAPCFEEMKYSKVLYEKVDKEKIEFIYLCTNSNSSKEKWEDTILEMEQKGIHIYANQKVINELMSELSINGFPSYALFNTEGEYLNGLITRMKTLTYDKLNEIIEK